MTEPLNVQRARFTAEHWRDALLEDREAAWAAHPLAMVLAALDGADDPTECGISPTATDDWPKEAI